MEGKRDSTAFRFPHPVDDEVKKDGSINKPNTNQQRKRCQQSIKQQIHLSLNTLRLSQPEHAQIDNTIPNTLRLITPSLTRSG
jgi:hypothetical protein